MKHQQGNIVVLKAIFLLFFDTCVALSGRHVSAKVLASYSNIGKSSVINRGAAMFSLPSIQVDLLFLCAAFFHSCGESFPQPGRNCALLSDLMFKYDPSLVSLTLFFW